MATPARSHSFVEFIQSSHQAVVLAGVFIGYIVLAAGWLRTRGHRDDGAAVPARERPGAGRT